PGLLMYLSRSLRLSGPLRSASLMLPHTGSIEWNKALLVVRDVDKPGLKNSSLNLSLEGVLDETETSVAYESRPAIVPAASHEDRGGALDWGGCRAGVCGPVGRRPASCPGVRGPPCRPAGVRAGVGAPRTRPGAWPRAGVAAHRRRG